MEAIIVCGKPAVGKTTVAKTIAKKLGLKVIGGGDILKEIAQEQGYGATGDDWWDTDEGMKFLAKRKGSPKFDKEVDERLLKKAGEGDIVITSYTLPWISKRGTKVWLSGTTRSRAERMAKRDSSTAEECLRIIKKRDVENHALYKKLYDIEFGNDLSPFDLIVGTDRVEASAVARQVLGHLKKVKS